MGEFLFQHGYHLEQETAMHNTTVKRFLKTALILSGLVLLAVFIIIALLPWMDRWGAAEDELPAAFSGDELVVSPFQ